MNTNTQQRVIELLAPARDAATAIEAIKHGADAVYMGATSHGARAMAGNTIEDISSVVDYAHRFNARVYVTVNTIIYDDELRTVERLIKDLYRIGVDALIIQDMAILRMDIPPIALHASTQCDTRGPAKALFLERLGFSQIVLARELSLSEIAEIHSAVKVPLEAFVHGALCVSYSGDCQASHVSMNRSANRGECAQMCRLPYNLIDGNGNRLLNNKYLLSLRDLNRSADIAAMLDAGVSSFKIEGRLKDVAYVKNTVSAYRQAIDRVIDSNPDKYRRLSFGSTHISFEPALEKSFNRGFTRYFADDSSSRQPMASIDTPKSVGIPVGTVKHCAKGRVIANLNAELHNGDGLGYFTRDGEFCGFRLNRVEGNTLYPATALDIPPKTILYRNKDKAWDDLLSRDSATRSISANFSLRTFNGGIALDATDSRGNSITVTTDCEVQPANTPQEDTRRRILEKTGGTIYHIDSINDSIGDIFIPASLLTNLRRQALESLDKAQRATFKYDYRKATTERASLPMGDKLSYHDNVSNRLARDFYKELGAKSIAPAIELSIPSTDIVVMTTRYCLRRELGYCLKTPNGRAWQPPLHIETGNISFRLDFDCSHCRMKVIKEQ